MEERRILEITSGDPLPGVNEPIRQAIPSDTRSKASFLYSSAFRYHGRKPWNLIREYIRHFAPREGQLVGDPFIGSGVTTGEALRLRRRVIGTDLQPISELVNRVLGTYVSPDDLGHSVAALIGSVIPEFRRLETDSGYAMEVIGRYDIEFLNRRVPNRIARPGAERYIDAFEPSQAAALLVLRDHIERISPPAIQNYLWLAFTNVLIFASKGYHGKKTKSGDVQRWRGDHVLFRYQRLGSWQHATRIPLDEILIHCIDRVVRLNAMVVREYGEFIRSGEKAWFLRTHASRFAEAVRTAVGNEPLDYVITDPPYGQLVKYSDIMSYWNVWLPGGDVDSGQALEAISDKSQFVEQLGGVIESASSVLKEGGWMTLFYLDIADFQLWKSILERAGDSKLELVNSNWMVQSIPSPTQTQNPMTGIRGAVIANFRRLRTPIRNIPLQQSPRPLPTLYNYLQLELQRIVVENLGATTSEILTYLSDEIYTRTNLELINPETTPSIPDLLKEIGAEELRPLSVGDKSIWSLASDVLVDESIDAYDRLRFSLFRQLAVSGGATISELAREVFTGEHSIVGGRRIPPVGVKSALSTFAMSSPDGSGRWVIDWARRNSEAQLRLQLSSSSAHAIRSAMERRQDGSAVRGSDHLVISAIGLGELADAAPGKGVESVGWRRISQALLVLLRILRDDFGGLIESVTAVHETSRGEWDPDEPAPCPLPLLILLRSEVDIPDDLEGLLVENLFGPLYERSRIDFIPYFRTSNSRDLQALFGVHAAPITLLHRLEKSDDQESGRRLKLVGAGR